MGGVGGKQRIVHKRRDPRDEAHLLHDLGASSRYKQQLSLVGSGRDRPGRTVVAIPPRPVAYAAAAVRTSRIGIGIA